MTSDHPHAGSKLSSAVEGANDELETLASGHVGSTRPLVEKRK